MASPRLFRKSERIQRLPQTSAHLGVVLFAELVDVAIECPTVCVRHSDTKLVALATVKRSIHLCVHPLAHACFTRFKYVELHVGNRHHFAASAGNRLPIWRPRSTIFLVPYLFDHRHRKGRSLKGRSVRELLSRVRNAHNGVAALPTHVVPDWEVC